VKRRRGFQDVVSYRPLMERLVRETFESGQEAGFNVCDVKGELELSGGDVCYGDECEVGVPRCQWPNTFLDFHTHPEESMGILSPGDFQNLVADDTKYVCIGKPDEDGGRIRCFKVNHETEDGELFRREFSKAYMDTLRSDVSEERRFEAREEMIRLIGSVTIGKNDFLELVDEWDVK